MHKSSLVLFFCSLVAISTGCSSSKTGTATVTIENDFNDPEVAYSPPWTLCDVSYLGTQFGQINLGQTSAAKTVTPGNDYVLIVAAWNDPTCSQANLVPIASEAMEEVVSGQTLTIVMEMNNHQGPCPPEGVAPIPEAQYDRILQIWPQFNFPTYANRMQLPLCAGTNPSSNTDAGTDSSMDGMDMGGGDAATDSTASDASGG